MNTIRCGSYFGAKFNNKVLEKVDSNFEGIYYVPDDVETIQHHAFKDCTKIQSIVMNDNVRSILKGAFEGCVSLTHIYLSQKISLLKDDTFRGCSSLKYIIVPEGVIRIGWSCFANCTSLQTLVLPSTLQYIGRYAFKNTALNVVHIPQNVNSIDPEAFEGCNFMEDFDVDHNNESYYSDKGVLYDIEEGKHRLYMFPNAKEVSSYHIAYVEDIFPNAIKGARFLKELYIPETIKCLQNGALSSPFLRSIHFLSSKPNGWLLLNETPDVSHDCIFYIPQGTLDDYQNEENVEDWMQFVEVENMDLP